MKKIKGHFSSPSVPPHQTRTPRALVVQMLSRWTPEGHCGCLVTQMYRPIRTIKTPQQNSNFMPPPSQKMSLPAHQNSNFMPPPPRKSKILTPNPNLTSNPIPSKNSNFMPPTHRKWTYPPPKLKFYAPHPKQKIKIFDGFAAEFSSLASLGRRLRRRI